jgi:hypothetical protein
MLLRFRQNNKRVKIDDWIKFAASDITTARVNMFGLKNVRFVVAVEKYISSFSQCFRHKNLDILNIPLLSNIKFYD